MRDVGLGKMKIGYHDAASNRRFLGATLLTRDPSNSWLANETASTAFSNAASLALDGFVEPLIFLTNCVAAARISSCVAGGSKLNSTFIFLHIISSTNYADIGASSSTGLNSLFGPGVT